MILGLLHFQEVLIYIPEGNFFDFIVEIGCSHQDALSILNTVRTDTGDKSSSPEKSIPMVSTQKDSNLLSGERTALELMYEQMSYQPIVTFNQDIDRMLGGGVPLGKVTEFCGVPGIGKTQMAIQLAVDVHIPEKLGGVEGHCIYIDTEGSLMPERVGEVATHLVHHLNNIEQSETEPIHVNSILDHIYYYRIHDRVELIALTSQLKKIISVLNEKNKNPIRLIIIDSITFHFRVIEQFKDMGQRTRLLTLIASQLMELASMNIAVVIINQVTTKPGHGIIPALGETWSHVPTIRVLLDMDSESGSRRATLIKSPDREYSSVLYQVQADGIR